VSDKIISQVRKHIQKGYIQSAFILQIGMISALWIYLSYAKSRNSISNEELK
jgi:hypothetical protein